MKRLANKDAFYIILFGKLALVRQSEPTDPDDDEPAKRIIGAFRIGKTVGEEVIVDQNYTQRLES